MNERKNILAARFDEGVALFNSGDYFACHEAWEDVWRELHGDRRIFVQGLIQIAVGLYHASRFNSAGARGLFSRGVARLERFPPDYCGVNVRAFLTAIAPCRAAIELRELPAGPILHYDPQQTSCMLFLDC